MAVTAVASLLVVDVLLGGRPLLSTWFPEVLGSWDQLWRQPFQQQVTGFVVLGPFVLALVYPLRTRLHLAPRRTSAVRLLHALLGMLALVAIILHSNLRLGANLNFAMSIAFLAFAVMGSLGSFSTGPGGALGRWRRWLALYHRVLLWPALALIGLHILAVYYF